MKEQEDGKMDNSDPPSDDVYHSDRFRFRMPAIVQDQVPQGGGCCMVPARKKALADIRL